MNNRSVTGIHVELEELVHAFLDGELPAAQQPRVFAHLAECEACRTMFGHVMGFRRMSRQEFLMVPPTADETFFQKLEAQKVQSARRDRGAERRPLWQLRRRVSVRAALIVGACLLLLGLLSPSASRESPRSFLVRGEVEHVEFRDVIYVIYPGLTVEAAKL